MSQKRFWETHVIDWEASAYEGAAAPGFLEKVASRFRGHLTVRFNMACKLLQELRPVSLLEIGCGQGRLLRRAIQEGWIQRGRGVDISTTAIENARLLARQAGLGEDCLTFQAAAVGEMDPAWLEGADAVIGLGLLQYLTDEEYAFLFGHLRGRTFAFDWHGRELSAINLMHTVYRLFRRYPFYRRFSEAQIRSLLAGYGFERPEIRREDCISMFVVRAPGSTN